MSMTMDVVPRQNENYCVRELDDGLIFLHPDGNRLHSLDAVGSFIWKAIDGQLSLARIQDLICEEYEVDAQTAGADLVRFTEELAELDLVLLSDDER